MRRLLWPLGLLYGWLGVLRVSAYRAGLRPTARAAGPVISVGNLSVGGSGKTPMVEWIARALRDAGAPAAVLSRGYGGRYDGRPLVVSDGRSAPLDASLAGDEPVMLARALPGVPVLVGRRRDEAARVAETLFGPRVHVLDDGFQHLRLARDLDLVCASGEDLRDWPLPAGRLREFAWAARRAHGVLLTGAGAPPAGVEAWRVSRRVLGCVDLEGGPVAPPRRPWLVSGIARPERFHADASAACPQIAGRDVFCDHHRFAAGEWARIADRARAAGADALLTTAKDAVRLPADAAVPLPVRVLRVAAEVSDEARFRDRLLSVAGGLV
jgi:tetraacyldisaccharide 4'-kinase